MILDIQDIINSVSVPALIKDEFIKRGTFARLKNGDLQACVGGFSIVFPVEVDGSKWAFRCWHHTLDNDQTRIKLLSAELKKVSLPYFIDFEYEDKGVVVNGAVYPTTRMKWKNGRDIKDYICYNRNNRHKLFKLASNFFAMTQDLHRLSIAHGDLQHENIIVNPFGKIFLIDYDSMYVPALSYMNSKNSTNGKEGYQHPARENCVYSNPTLDYFSEVVILTSILAIAHNPSLINKYDMEDSDTMLFKKADFRNFASSKIYSDLSAMGGIFVVLLKVLSSYLGNSDITSIDPLELAANKANTENAISIAGYLKNAENNLLIAEKEAEEKKEREEQEKKRKLELVAWRSASRKNTFRGYQVYLKEYPSGVHAEEARKRKSILGEELVSILNLCSEAHRKVAIKAEEHAWTEACRLNSASGFSSFIEAYPLSNYRYIAEVRLKECQESEGWEQARFSGSIRELERFVNNYPESIHVAEARMIIITLRDQLKEDDAWKIALDQNTTGSYRSYLRLYPIGRYSQTARFILAKKRKRIVKSFCIIIVVVVVAIIVAVISINRQSKGTRPTPGSGSGQDSGQTVSSTLPPHTPVISESELVGLEAKTEGQIEAMEVAKKVGDSRDTNMYKQAGQSLSNLKKYGSKKYNSLNDRYKAL